MASEARDRRQRRRNRQRGQTTIFVLVALAIFLLGFIGFGVDMTNLFFRRQKAQGAADAACQACAMDILAYYSGVSTLPMGFTPGTDFNCTGNPGDPAPCKYAALNGYDGRGPGASTDPNDVSFTFPGSVPGVTPPDPSLAAFPFVQVTVTDYARVFFSSLLTGARTQNVGASATCGLIQANAPVPLIVLNPSCPHAFEVSGSATVKIVGGPTKSIQVNSGNQTCPAATQSGGCSSNGTIDLQFGGPAFTGSNFGVFGGGLSATAPSRYFPGTTGRWLSPAAPVPDPFASTPAPSIASLPVPPQTGVLVPWVGVDPVGSHGCPDHAGCRFYQAGVYNQSILVKGETAIFEPGIYYIQPTDYPPAARSNCGTPGTGCIPNVTGQCAYDLLVESNGVIRMSTDTGDGSRGVMLYLSGPGGSATRPYGSVGFLGNAGNPGGRTIDPFNTSLVSCPGASPPDSHLSLPPTMDGNVLLGQCTGAGTYYGNNGEATTGPIRGILFFQDRRNGYGNGQPSMQGSGGMVLSGTMYFHHCNSLEVGDPTAGTKCQDPANGYQAFLNLQGTPGGGTFVLGNITTDQFVLGGNGIVSMQLDPSPVYHLLKATMLQ